MFSLVQLTQTFIELTKTKTTKINTKGSRKNGLFSLRLTVRVDPIALSKMVG